MQGWSLATRKKGFVCWPVKYLYHVVQCQTEDYQKIALAMLLKTVFTEAKKIENKPDNDRIKDFNIKYYSAWESPAVVLIIILIENQFAIYNKRLYKL